MQALTPASSRSGVVEEVFNRLFVLHDRLVDLLDRELEEACGVGLGEFLVLKSIDGSPEGRLRLSELADAALLSRSALSRRVDRLVAAAWVVRHGCPTDRRGTYAVITEEGRSVVRRGLPAFNRVLQSTLGARFDAGTLQALSDILNESISSLGEG